MASTFLPPDYEVTSSDGHYMKFQKGENRFRILDSPIIGLEYWSIQNKPVRLHKGDQIDIGDIRIEESGEKKMPKEFWALPVWNYAAKSVQVLEITQKFLLKAITELSRNSKWGNPREYDLVVAKTGDGMSTEYGMIPDPKESLEVEAATAWAEVQKKGFNLDMIYEGLDPFNPLKTKEETIDMESVEEIMEGDESNPLMQD
jgi:hypothetical protein